MYIGIMCNNCGKRYKIKLLIKTTIQDFACICRCGELFAMNYYLQDEISIPIDVIALGNFNTNKRFRILALSSLEISKLDKLENEI